MAAITGGRRDDVTQAADADIETRGDGGLDKLKGRDEVEINVPTASRRRANCRRHFLRRAAEVADEIVAAVLAFGDVDVHHQNPARQREPNIRGLVFRPHLRDDGGVGRGARNAMLEETLNLDRRFPRGTRKDAAECCVAERGFERSCHSRATPARMTCHSAWQAEHNCAVGQVWQSRNRLRGTTPAPPQCSQKNPGSEALARRTAGVSSMMV